jgi:hypothetical protein
MRAEIDNDSERQLSTTAEPISSFQPVATLALVRRVLTIAWAVLRAIRAL